MHGHKFDWFVFELQLCWLVAAFCRNFGLAGIYVSPYILIANAVFANQLIDYSKREVK